MAVEPNVIRDEEVLDRLVAAREQIWSRCVRQSSARTRSLSRS
jgi:hypothetical protein